MAQNITLYDVLGLTPGASADTIRRARDERMRQLRPALETGAPSPVVAAAARAEESVEVAALVLTDPEARLRYDRQIGLHRDRGLRGPGGFAEGVPGNAGDPYGLLRAGAALLDGALWESFAAMRGWMTPGPTPPARHVTVPDLRGLFFRAGLAAATMSGFRLAVVRLTADPAPVEGLVTGQSPAPAAIVRRQSVLTVQVWHPARSSGARPGEARTRSE